MINVCNMLDIILKCIINVHKILVHPLFKMFKNKLLQFAVSLSNLQFNVD